jgi:hypothetical protein
VPIQVEEFEGRIRELEQDKRALHTELGTTKRGLASAMAMQRCNRQALVSSGHALTLYNRLLDVERARNCSTLAHGCSR